MIIDADDAPASKMDVVLAEVAPHGDANVRRAKGDCKSPHLQQWEAAFHPYAIRPMRQLAYRTGKNAADMAMVIDAMDLLNGGSIGAFALVSSNADFTPLVMRILANGHQVYGFGERKTPEPIVNACSLFTYVEGLGQAPNSSNTSVEQRADPWKLRGDTRLVLLMRNAVEAASDHDGWANLSSVGSQISNQASLDSRNYGYQKLSELIS
ncbi:NYN domain-containing protein [Arthrobacter sp. TMT4-20]